MRGWDEYAPDDFSEQPQWHAFPVLPHSHLSHVISRRWQSIGRRELVECLRRRYDEDWKVLVPS